MKKNMNANTENSGKSNVDDKLSAHSQNNTNNNNTKKSSQTSNSLNVILPQFTVIDQQNLFDQNGKRTVQSSPSKSHRKFSQDSGFSANRYKNVSDCSHYRLSNFKS